MTWLTLHHMEDFDISGYSLHSSQMQGRGKGVAVYVKQKHSYEVHSLSTGKCLSLLIMINTVPSFLIVLIYKPRTNTSHQFSDILDKLLKEMENYATDYKIIGVLNHDYARFETPTTVNNTLRDPMYITPVRHVMLQWY